MGRYFLTFISAFMVFGSSMLSVSAYAASTYTVDRHGHDARAYVLASNKSLSLAQAADKLRSRVGGRVLGAKVVEAEGRTVYEIKVLLKPGKVKVYWVDPHSGKVL